MVLSAEKTRIVGSVRAFLDGGGPRGGGIRERPRPPSRSGSTPSGNRETSARCARASKGRPWSPLSGRRRRGAVSRGAPKRPDRSSRRRSRRASTSSDVEYRAGTNADLMGLAPSKVVVSVHDLEGLPPDVAGLAERMAATGARYVKVVGTANDSNDAVRLLEAQKSFEGSNVSLFGMGEAGIATRVLAPYFGAPLMFASIVPGGATAPGQLQARDLRDVYGVGRARRASRLVALLGSRVSHSLLARPPERELRGPRRGGPLRSLRPPLTRERAAGPSRRPRSPQASPLGGVRDDPVQGRSRRDRRRDASR